MPTPYSDRCLMIAVVALSPATDFTGGSPSLVSRASVDPIINPAILPALVPVYLGKNAESTDPYASPLFGDYTGMPPILLQVSDLEVLLDDSTRLAKHAVGQGCNVTIGYSICVRQFIFLIHLDN